MTARAPLNAIHHLLGLPLGTAYFTLFVTGIAVGGGLAIVGVGLVILVATLALARPLGDLERRLANALLDAGAERPPARPRLAGAIAWVADVVTDRQTWRSLAYLLARFPLGLFSFTVTVTLLGTGIALAGAPVHHRAVDLDLGFWSVDSMGEALAVAPLGVVLLFATVPVVTGLGTAQATVARALLGRPRPRPGRLAAAVVPAPA